MAARPSSRRSSRRPSSGRSAVVARAPVGAAPAGGVPWVPVVLGLGAVGVGAYFLLKPRAAAAVPPPVPTTLLRSGASSPAFLPPPPSGLGVAGVPGAGAAGTTYGPGGIPDPPPALVLRLRGSSSVRQVFALQALLYSYGFTEAVPDGLEGPVTDGLIGAVNQLRGRPGDPTRFAPQALANAREAMEARFGGGPTHLLPFTLPPDVIASVNNDALAADGAYPLLQVQPTTAPAGQVIPTAGYGRPFAVHPSNTVGASPGLGALTDPQGLNIGLWEALRSGWHGPIGTGQVAADVGQNPIAGQGGGYAQGWR